MMVGEIDLVETVHKNDQLKYEQLFVVNILIIVFILIAVVVLQNMLIAITIDDLEVNVVKTTISNMHFRRCLHHLITLFVCF